MAKSEEAKSLKSAMVMFGALAFGWMAIELAFKPLLDKVRSAINKSDPTRDPDDEDDEDDEADAADEHRRYIYKRSKHYHETTEDDYKLSLADLAAQYLHIYPAQVDEQIPKEETHGAIYNLHVPSYISSPNFYTWDCNYCESPGTNF